LTSSPRPQLHAAEYHHPERTTRPGRRERWDAELAYTVMRIMKDDYPRRNIPLAGGDASYFHLAGSPRFGICIATYDDIHGRPWATFLELSPYQDNVAYVEASAPRLLGPAQLGTSSSQVRA
jgi:hypothetical protein